LYSPRMLTTDEARNGLSEERQQLVHLREGVRLPRVTLQHGPAGGHVQSGRIYGVHSRALRRLRGGGVGGGLEARKKICLYISSHFTATELKR